MDKNILGFHKVSNEELKAEMTFYVHPLNKTLKNEPVTVRQLIEILQEMPEDAPSYYFDDDGTAMGVCDIGKSNNAVYFHLF